MCMCAQDGFGMSPRIKCHQDIDMYMGVEIVMIKMKVKIRRVMEESEVKLVKIREDMEDTRGMMVTEVREVGHGGHEAEQGGHGAKQGRHVVQRLNTLSYL